MTTIQNSYNAFINSWKSIIDYINTDQKTSIGLPPAATTILDIGNIIDEKYQPCSIRYVDADNVFALCYDFHNINVEIYVKASSIERTVDMVIVNRSNSYPLGGTCAIKNLPHVFYEVEKINSWEYGPDIDTAILKLVHSKLFKGDDNEIYE